VRLVRDRANKASRGFAFVEFHRMEDARAVLAKGGSYDVDGSSARVAWARDTSRSGRGPNEAFGAESAATEAQHQGPKRAGFGVPPGFEPDQVSPAPFSCRCSPTGSRSRLGESESRPAGLRSRCSGPRVAPSRGGAPRADRAPRAEALCC